MPNLTLLIKVRFGATIGHLGIRSEIPVVETQSQLQITSRSSWEKTNGMADFMVCRGIVQFIDDFSTFQDWNGAVRFPVKQPDVNGL